MLIDSNITNKLSLITSYKLNKKINRLLRNLYIKNQSKIQWTTIFTKNNIFSTIYSIDSKITLTKSAGSIGIRSKRTSNLVYRYLIKIFSLFLICSNNKPIISVFFKNKLSLWKKKKLIQLIKKTDTSIKQIYNFSTTAHGGTKKRKKRRL